MPISLFRVDDRLIHGQVVVGWGQPLSLKFIVLVDDSIASSEWEQELYRMGVPPDVTVYFVTVEEAAKRLSEFETQKMPGVVVAGDISTMLRLVSSADGRIKNVNIGGVHHIPGRAERLRYVYLSAEEEQQLREIAGMGVNVSAQDVPSARPVPLDELLNSSLGG